MTPHSPPLWHHSMIIRARNYFKSLDFSSLQTYDQELVDQLLETDEFELNRGLAKVFYSYVDGLTRFPDKTNSHHLLGFLAQIPDRHLSRSTVLSFFTDYLASLTQMRSALGAISADRKFSFTTRSSNREELGPAATKAAQTLEQRKTAGASLLLGQLYSLVDRKKAKDCFIEGTRGNEDTIELFGIDTGCLTYFSDIDQDLASARMAGINIQFLSTNTDELSPSGVLISVDDRFFRIYAPLILLYAHHLPQHHFHIVYVGSTEEVGQAAALREKYQSLLHDYTGLPVGSNVSIHHCELPQWVPTPRTFYACARFLALPVLLNRHETLYMMDADSYINDDLTPLLSALAHKADIAIPLSRGYAVLAPWKRYIANSVFIKRTPSAFDFLHTVNRYIAYGLSEPRSWMLDQNALAYAFEQHREVKFEDLNLFKRVTNRPMIFSSFEKNIRPKKQSILRDQQDQTT
jgi:hypothetical protein